MLRSFLPAISVAARLGPRKSHHPASASAQLHVLLLPFTFLEPISSRLYYYLVLQQIVKGRAKTKLATNSARSISVGYPTERSPTSRVR